MKKIMLVTSRGGHLFQLILLKALWEHYDRVWVTFQGSDVDSLLKNEVVSFAFYPESRHLLNAFRNFWLAVKLLRQECPDVVMSCGAGIAPPFLLAAKLLSVKTIYIEPYDFIHHPTLSGRLVYPFVDLFLVQHKLQLTFFPRAKYWGSTL